MREIEFRAKKDKSNNWVYGYYHKLNESFENKDCILEHHRNTSTIIDGNTLGQYTGLKDKKGKKIYEGDILRLPAYLFDGETCVCVYQGTDTGIGFELIESRRYCLGYDGRILSDEWEDFEVIGNIYDNPELLGDICNENK